MSVGTSVGSTARDKSPTTTQSSLTFVAVICYSMYVTGNRTIVHNCIIPNTVLFSASLTLIFQFSTDYAGKLVGTCQQLRSTEFLQ